MRPPLMMPPPVGPVVLTPPGMSIRFCFAGSPVSCPLLCESVEALTLWLSFVQAVTPRQHQHRKAQRCMLGRLHLQYQMRLSRHCLQRVAL